MTTPPPPGPKGLPVAGKLLDFRRDQLGFLMQMKREYGDVVYYRLGPQPVFQINHPDMIQQILVTKADQFQKGRLDHQILERPLGNGLLTSEGEFHSSQRKLAQPAFHSKRIETYADVMVSYTQKLMDGWADGQACEMHSEMTRLTLFIVSKTLYDADVSDSADGIAEAIYTINHIAEDQYLQGFVLPEWLPIPQNVKSRRAFKVVDSILMPIIERRRVSGEDKGDFLSMLLMAQDEDTGGQMTDQQVRDEAITLFIAGHETTSNAMSWAWYLLSQHPEVEAKLHAELDTALNGRTPTLHDLAALPYNEMVIKEALRLYPPAWILNGREPIDGDVEIGGYTITKGSYAFLSPYVMHRDPRYFDQPEAFMPERWANGFEKQIPRYAYFPFGGGPRVCIGNSFAMMEARLILATIAQRYRPTMPPGTVVEPNPLVTLQPRGGVPMTLEARNPVAKVEEKQAVVEGV
jgi:cytochrome P450